MKVQSLNERVAHFKEKLGTPNAIIQKDFFIGKEPPINAVLIYINGFVDKNIIDRDILKPLMLSVNENLTPGDDIPDYLIKRYITMSSTYVERDINKAVQSVKSGASIIFIENCEDVIVIGTEGMQKRSISEPYNETSIRGSREGFIESLEVNMMLIKKRLRDKNLMVEKFILGRRSQVNLALVYIKDIADDDVVTNVRNRVTSLNVDFVSATGVLDQMIEKYPYSIFPQSCGSERPDVIVSRILEGRVALILEGTPYVLAVPSLFTDFFQSVEDYYERTLVSIFVRFLRITSVFIVILLPSIYLALIKFNAELIPIKFIIPIVQSRRGIALTPFLEIISMELVVEFLREGGLRLPSKIGQTLGIVGGFIIGDAAIRTKFISPATLVVIGVSVIASFVITNYEMSLSIRLIRFPMLIITNMLGVLGIAAGVYIILVYLYSMDSFGVPYFPSGKYKDLKDTLTRVPLWKMNLRPKSIPNKNPIRQKDFRNKMWRKENEKGRDK